MIDRVSRLAAAMRAQGSATGLGEVLLAHRALAAVDAADRVEAHHALRAAMCRSHADLGAFEAAFAAVFTVRRAPQEDPLEQLGDMIGAALPRVADPDRARRVPADADREPVPAAWSDHEVVRRKDFAALTDAERQVAIRLLRALARRGPQRSSRRTRPARRRRGDVHDLRATVRASLPRGGELLERRWRAPTRRPRRVVLVLDVSGSMAPYARMLLHYAHSSVAAHRRAEAFVFGTRLTRVTRELGVSDADRAIARVTEVASDLGAGTRIGSALGTLNREHGRRIGRGSIVVLLSDGWDRGEPAELAAELERLARCAHRLVWLNPLAADPSYAPLTRGMLAALPHIDRLMPAESVASLEALAGLMEEGIR